MIIWPNTTFLMLWNSDSSVEMVQVYIRETWTKFLIVNESKSRIRFSEFSVKWKVFFVIKEYSSIDKETQNLRKIDS